MMLCPQPWPMPGKASYSQSTAIVGPSLPARAANAVSRPYTLRSTVKPPPSSMSHSSSAANRSSKSSSGCSWIRCDAAIRASAWRSTSASRRSLAASTSIAREATPPSNDDRQGVWLDTQGQGAGLTAVLPVEVDGPRAVELDLNGGCPTLVDPRVWQVLAVTKPRSHLQPVGEREIGLVNVEQPVVGVTLPADEPRPEKLGVHAGDHVPPPARPGHHMGHEHAEMPVEQDLAQVDRETHGLQGTQPRLVTAAPERAAQVAAQEPERGERTALRASPLDDRAR